MKAAGPDGIINRVLHVAAVQIAPHLTRIFNWSLRLGYCPAHFRQSTTIVLRKQGKDDYTAPKAYRPIALLKTVGKLMDSIIAKRISYVTETYQLLPSTHIGGRKGRSTEHATHPIRRWQAFYYLTSLELSIMFRMTDCCTISGNAE